MSNYIKRADVLQAIEEMPSIVVSGNYVFVGEDMYVNAIKCKDCKYRYTDGEHVIANYCELNHNRVQADDWFCADAERKEE